MRGVGRGLKAINHVTVFEEVAALISWLKQTALLGIS